MKLRFNQVCRDKHTGETYEKGKTYEFADERGKEILKSGYAEEVVVVQIPKEPTKQEPPKEEPTAPTEPQDLETKLDSGMVVNLHELSKEELVKLAKKEGVSIRGNKDDIIERLLAKAE